MTVAVAASLEGRTAGMLNLGLVATLGLGGILRGAFGESLAIALAGKSDAAIRQKEAVVATFVRLTTTSFVAGPLLLVFGAPLWTIVLVAAVPPFAAHMLWRSLAAVLNQSIVSLASSAIWLLAQSAFFLLLLITDGSSPLLLCLGWLIGVTAALGLAVALSNPDEWMKTRLRSSVLTSRASDIVYAVEGTLAFAGPQLVVVVAAAGLGVELVTDFRLIAVILGPIAVVGSGLRLAWVGTRDLTMKPLRLLLWTALLIGPISALGAVLVLQVLFVLGDVFVTGHSSTLLLSVGLLAFARAVGASAALPLARLRSTAAPSTFLRARILTVAASASGVFIGSQLAGLSMALVGASLAALASAALYFVLDLRAVPNHPGQ